MPAPWPVIGGWLALAAAGGDVTMDVRDLPADLPAGAAQDAVMASPDEVQAMADWTAAAWTGVAAPERTPRVPLTCRRQDYNVLQFGRSCLETPLRIGRRSFTHGLGTHANSEVAVTLPAGARRFEAAVGIDHNDSTGGVRGSVQFLVELDGAEVYRSAVLRGSDEATPVAVDLPGGARELVLKVDTTPDGPAHDQADWADAKLVMADGTVRWLDEHQPEPFLLSTEPPCSFVYGGVPSAELLPKWPRTVATHERDDWTEHQVTWTDPATGLRVQATVKAFRRYPAAEWVLTFENTGTAETPILEQVQALDVRLRTANNQRAAVLHRLHGDACGETSFLPYTTPLPAGQTISLAPTGGRPSNTTACPYFNLQYGDRGLLAAVGWTGQWAASLERSDRAPTRLRAGMELTHLKLHPGERIRTPRILLLPWQGDRVAAHNRWRRLLLFHYSPQQEGRPVALPIVSQCFDRYSWTRPEWATEVGQIQAAEFAHAVGCDAHWLDAAWFVGGFPNGVGNWFCKPAEFPRGLHPVAEACHRMGLKFVVWFEPERVAAESQIARERPEYVHGGAQGGLFRLDDAAARAWLTELLSQRIAEFGIDVYRNDFNLDPLPYWRAADAPDRQGMTEIRYVEGLYELWDTLRTRHPGLQIDNCASGGRRIDFELGSRSMPLWRSDTSCSPGHPEWNQAQSCGLGLYVPLHTACGWTPDPYEFRSSATGGAICQWDYLQPEFPLELAKATLAEARADREYWYGDFYPLTACGTELDELVAWQLHRPDRNAGLLLAFRRPNCATLGLIVAPHALDPDTTYRFEFVDDARQTRVLTLTGRQAAEDGLTLKLPQPRSSLVVRYRPA